MAQGWGGGKTARFGYKRRRPQVCPEADQIALGSEWSWHPSTNHTCLQRWKMMVTHQWNLLKPCPKWANDVADQKWWDIWEYMEGGFETVKWWDIPIASPIDNHYNSLLPFINSHFGKMKRRKMKYNRAGKSSRYRNKYSSFLPPEL